MKFIKSWKFMAIILAVLFVCALAGVIYGVVTHGERDAGLMEGFEPWDRTQFPLRVCPASYAIQPDVEEDDHENAEYVVELINQRLDFAALAVVNPTFVSADARDCHIILTYGVPHEVHDMEYGEERVRWTVVDDGGAAQLRDGYCYASTTNVFGEIRTLVVEHELGHCLGLDHDDFDSSIMRRSQSETPDRQFPPRITDHDRQLLRTTYGH